MRDAVDDTVPTVKILCVSFFVTSKERILTMNSNQYLAEEKISALMLKFSVPCIMSLMVSSLYNIVDQIFIGRGVGYLGNGATNVVFPITIIALALALLIGDACAAFLSLSLGKGDTESAHKSVGSSIVLSIGVSILLVVLFLAGQETILQAFGATENNIEYAREYFFIIVLGIPFYVFTNAMNSIIRADGSPAFAMISTLVGCIINVIFDPITILFCTGVCAVPPLQPLRARSSPLYWLRATCSTPSPSN